MAIHRSDIARYLQTSGGQLAIDSSQILGSIPAHDPETIPTAMHPAVLQEGALVRQQEMQKRDLDRGYVPYFSASGAVSGRGAGTNANGNFRGGTAGLAPSTFNWAAGVQVTFSAFDYFSLREQKRVQTANVPTEQARYNQVLDDNSIAIEQLERPWQVLARLPRTLRSNSPRLRRANNSSKLVTAPG